VIRHLLLWTNGLLESFDGIVAAGGFDLRHADTVGLLGGPRHLPNGVHRLSRMNAPVGLVARESSEYHSGVLQGREIQEMAERLLSSPPDRRFQRTWDVVRGPLILAAWVLGIALVVAMVVSVISALMQGPPNPF
jgi:hypothetical protein